MARIAGAVSRQLSQRERHDNVQAMLGRMPGNGAALFESAYATIGQQGSHGGLVSDLGDLVALDGDILNAQDLLQLVPGSSRDQGHLVLALIRRLGFQGALEKLIGDFAIAYFDSATRKTWLGRDRVGVKPLYYALVSEDVYFASQPAPLSALPCVGAGIDHRYTALVAGSHYRTFDNAIDRSPFQSILQLPAGHFVAISESSASPPQPYWRLSTAVVNVDDEAVLAEEYKALLLEAVGNRLQVADRPAFTLSGGMDSSSVLACAAKISGSARAAFSSVYTDPTFDERSEIRDILDAGLADWSPIELNDNIDVLSAVQRLVRVHNEPVATATWLSHDVICSAVARKGYGSLFGGLGGDELNAGEYEYFPLHFADLRAQGDTEQLAAEINRWSEYHDHPIHRKNPVIATEMMALLTDPDQQGICLPNVERQRRYYSAVRIEYYDLASFTPIMDHPFQSYLANRAYQDLRRETTPCCLRAEDRQSEYYGLCHFDPFLDHRLVEFMFSVPGSLKIRNGVTKFLLRKAMAGILPAATRNRIKKTGWNAPAHKWFSGEGLVTLRDLVASQSFRNHGVYNADRVNQIIDEHEAIVSSGANKENHMMFLWQLVNLEAWLDWIDAGMPADTAAST